MSNYLEVRQRVQQLTPEEQLRLLEELTIYVHRHQAQPAQRSILELRGLGKAIWQGMDAQAYVDQERESWNG
jgi:hypothetical protein